MIKFILNMPTYTQDYFQYLLPCRELNVWGLAITGSGVQRILPEAVYPGSGHPSKHLFTWEVGRILESLQIVLIERGRGVYETLPTGPMQVEAGMAFVLIPGAWHRFRPDPATGWDESWIEVEGPIVEQFIKHGVFSGASCLRTGAYSVGLDKALDQVHALVRPGVSSFNPELSAAAYSVIAAWAQMEGQHSAPSRLDQAVLKAERYLQEHFTEAVNVEELAMRLGVAYSHFRRAFRKHTGYAPWQYILRLRLARGRRQLAANDQATLEEIAAQLGFSSGFHFSMTFKKAFGMAPDRWRRQMHSLVNMDHPQPLPFFSRPARRANWTKNLDEADRPVGSYMAKSNGAR